MDKNTADCLVHYLSLHMVVTLMRVSKQYHEIFNSTIRFKKFLNLRRMADNFHKSMVMDWDMLQWAPHLVNPHAIIKYVFTNKVIPIIDLKAIILTLQINERFSTLCKFMERKMLKHATLELISWYRLNHGFVTDYQTIINILWVNDREDLHQEFNVSIIRVSIYACGLKYRKLKNVGGIMRLAKGNLATIEMSLVDDRIMQIFPFNAHIPKIYPYLGKRCTVEQYEFIDHKFHNMLSNVMEEMTIYAAFGWNYTLLDYLLPLVKKSGRKAPNKILYTLACVITKQTYMIFKTHDMLPWITPYFRTSNIKWWD